LQGKNGKYCLIKNESIESEIKEKPEKTIPGFEMIYCIIGLLGVFLWRKG